MDRFSKIEIEDAPVTPGVEFTPAGGLQTSGTATSRNGVFLNALGLESTAEFRHVAKRWQETCVPFTAIESQVAAEAAAKFDRIVPESAVRLDTENDLQIAGNDVIGDPVALTDNGRASLRLFTEVPSSMITYLAERGYGNEISRYVNEDLDRRAAQWADRHDDARDFRLRFRNDNQGNPVVRAVVSDQYGVIDNHEALQIFREAVGPDVDKYLASHVSNNGDDIFVNFLVPDTLQSDPDSDYGIGIAFRNSEIRNSTLKVSPFLFRAICLNGMIWGRANSNVNVNKRHRGTVDRFELRENIAYAVKAALSHGQGMKSLLEKSKEVRVENPLQTIAQLSRDQKLTTEQGRAWHRGYLQTLEEKSGHIADRTAFGIVNGLTRAAQEYSGAIRESLESTSSVILAPAIDADLAAIQKRWGTISQIATGLSEETVRQYQYVAR